MVGRDFGLMRQRNRTTDASMWLRNDLCAGLFRCCGVHVLCTMPADARRPTICRCKQTDSADLRPFETRASSCELVVRHCARPLACLPSESPLNMCSQAEERSQRGSCRLGETYGCIDPLPRKSNCDPPPRGGVWIARGCDGTFRAATGQALHCGANRTTSEQRERQEQRELAFTFRHGEYHCLGRQAAPGNCTADERRDERACREFAMASQRVCDGSRPTAGMIERVADDGSSTQCTTSYPLANTPPADRLPAAGTCLVLNLCWRENLAGVYRDRIPRWTAFGIPTYSVDSCTNASDPARFTTPDVTPLSFAGETGTCRWSCVTMREKVALRFAHAHLPSSCDFVFWVSATRWS